MFCSFNQNGPSLLGLCPGLLYLGVLNWVVGCVRNGTSSLNGRGTRFSGWTPAFVGGR